MNFEQSINLETFPAKKVDKETTTFWDVGAEYIFSPLKFVCTFFCKRVYTLLNQKPPAV